MNPHTQTLEQETMYYVTIEHDGELVSSSQVSEQVVNKLLSSLDECEAEEIVLGLEDGLGDCLTMDGRVITVEYLG